NRCAMDAPDPLNSTSFVSTTSGCSNELWAWISPACKTRAVPDRIDAPGTTNSASSPSLACGLTTVTTNCLSCNDAEPESASKRLGLPASPARLGTEKMLRNDCPP